MNKIWANRLIAGTKTWDDVPPSRKAAILEELKTRVKNNEITKEQFKFITGEIYE
jgi:hypothetical protein